MTPEDAINAHLDTIDAAADFWAITADDQNAPSLHEWNARRLLAGLLVDTFEEYIAAIKSGKRWNHE